MVDVGDKEITDREAVAHAVVLMEPETLKAIVGERLPKGDVFTVAKLAAVMAAKRTADLVPLCHPVPLCGVEVSFKPQSPESGAGVARVEIETRVRAVAKTGVEMEALTAASVAALTVYDMCKGIEKGMTIAEVYLLKKSGGRSGSYERSPDPP